MLRLLRSGPRNGGGQRLIVQPVVSCKVAGKGLRGHEMLSLGKDSRGVLRAGSRKTFGRPGSLLSLVVPISPRGAAA